MALALDGMRVLDLSRLLPGPYCTMILADMGAEVTKIEEPQPRWKVVDLLASVSPIDSSDSAGTEELVRIHHFVDRNKKSIALDLKSKEARKILYKLVEAADVLVEDFRPGVTKRLGADYNTLSTVNPRLIYCSITGYGQDGPYRDMPGHDPNYIAMAGILGITGTEDGNIALPGVPMADLGGGSMQAVVGILCALLAREKTGRGQYIDTAMLDGMVSWVAIRHGAQFFVNGKQPNAGDRPAHVYQTKDGKRICVAPAEPWFWERLCRALGLEEYIPYHQDIMSWIPGEKTKRYEIICRMSDVFSTKTREEWLQILTEVDTCVSSVNTFAEAFTDPHILQRQMMVEVNHPQLGKVKQVGIVPKLSETPGSIRTLPPQRGEHTDEILVALGYTSKQVNELRKAGIVK